MPDKALDVIDEAGALVSNRKDKLVTDEDVLKVVAQLSGVPVSGLKSDASVKVLGLQGKVVHEIASVLSAPQFVLVLYFIFDVACLVHQLYLGPQMCFKIESLDSLQL